MNFTALHYFLVATQTQNFSKAAARLHISQQAFSNYIKSLEDEFRVKLFVRGKKNTLTYAGMRLAAYAADIVALEESMYQEMEHLQAQDKGNLRITVNETRASALMPVVLEKFYKKYPYVEVSLIEGDASRVEDSILTSDADFGVGLGLEKSGVHFVKIRDEKLCLIVPRKFVTTLFRGSADVWEHNQESIDFQMLKDIPFIMLNETMTIRGWTDEYLKSVGIQPNILFEATSLQTLFSMACRGLGVAICAESFLYSFESELELRENDILVFPLHARSRELRIFSRAPHTLSKYAKYCSDLICEYYASRSIEYRNGKVIIRTEGDM